MIASLRGIVSGVEKDAVIVDLHGFGLRIFAPTRTLAALQPGSEAALVTHLIVREDLLALYGFSEQAELDLFLRLLGVTGVGPKVALAVLSFADPGTIYTAIADGDAKLLAKIPGIGARTAERIVLDLRGKLPKLLPAGTSPSVPVDNDALAALEALGYDPLEARGALAAIEGRAGMTVEERVIAALQRLAPG